MIAKTVAEWLSINITDLDTDDNLTLNNLASTDKEGVSVLFNREIVIDGSFDNALLQILIFYYDNVVGNNLMKKIITALDAYRGVVGESWSVSGSIKGEGFGIDKINRNIFSISVEVAYKEA
jgi:hypothetical protein